MLKVDPTTSKKLEDIYPLSPMQEGMLLHSLLDTEVREGVYHQQLLWDLEGTLNLQNFTKAWEKVILSHPILRTGFYWKNLEKPLQVVFRHLSIPIQVEDIETLISSEQDLFIEDYLKRDKSCPFILEKPPLMRLILFKRGPKLHTFLWSHHHIILDGWSIALLLEEVVTTYEKLVKLLPCPMKVSSTPPFIEYIKWLQNQDLASAESFWRQELKGFFSPLSCQDAVHSRNSRPTQCEEERILTQDLVRNIRELARKERWTIATLLQSAWAYVQSRYCSTEDVVFGLTISGRPAQLLKAECMVGLFINTLPLRIKISEKISFREWINEIQAKQHQLKNWDYVPLAKIQEWSEISSSQPLFKSIFVFENYPVKEAHSLGSLKILNGRPIETTNYPLTLSIAFINSEQISVKLKYDTGSYSHTRINGLLDYLQTLLNSFTQNVDNCLKNLPQLSFQEEKKLKTLCFEKKFIMTEDLSLSLVFEKYAKDTPEAIAIIDENQSYSYREINSKANQLAMDLIALGAQKEKVIGIGLKRSVDAIVAILAVWKAGAAYVPLDLSLPLERVLKIFEICTPLCLITKESPEVLSQLGDKVKILNLTQKLAERIINITPQEFSKNQLAYILFTSGSTGIPKAVMVEHGSLINIAQGWREKYCLNQMEVRLLQVANFSFDVFIGDMARCFFNGGMMVICSDEMRLNLPGLYRLLEKHSITIFESTPGLILPLIEYIHCHRLSLNTLRILILGSDGLRREDFFSLKERLPLTTRIINSYGITEATIDTSYFEECHPDLEGKEFMWHAQNFASPYVPLGYPFPNMKFYILDENLNLVPIGVKGEIYIAGAGLARGYCKDPSLTAEKYIPDPFKVGERMYRTGDFGHWLYEGGIEFLGRSDDQIKIRGHRVSLTEISLAIEAFGGVLQSVVVSHRQNENSFLCGYYTLKDFVDEQKLRDHLSQLLPAYMIPSTFVCLQSFLLTPNGKVDRKSLPFPSFSPNMTTPKRKPITKTEEIIYEIWKEILNVEEIDTHSSFFEVGGNSLLILKLFNKLCLHFEQEISVVDLFTYPTISQIATYIMSKKSNPKKNLSQIMQDLEQGRITTLEAQQQMELI